MIHRTDMTAEQEAVSKRFWPKVRKSAECWIWTGWKYKDNYGRMRCGRNIVKSAHRISWLLNNGAIPKGLHVLHRCDNPPCVNPKHLFLGTALDNARDCVLKNRHAKGSTSGRRKLEESDIYDIRRRYVYWSGGMLAREYNVSPSLIRRIARREIWKHLA